MKITYIQFICTLFLLALGLQANSQETSTNLNPKDEFTYHQHTTNISEQEVFSDPNIPLETNVNSLNKISSSGVGETPGSISVSLTGGATYTVPIAVPPGIGNVAPEIALSYNSQSKDGIAGKGWNLSGLSTISRIPSTKYHDGINDPVDFDNLDRFALDGQRLILKSGTYGAHQAEYQTENYSNLKITSYGTSPLDIPYSPNYFLVQYPDGSKGYYGVYRNNSDSQSALEYALSYWENPQGIRISYEYSTDNGILQISKISYGSKGSTTPVNEIQFKYETRISKETSYIGGIRFTNENVIDEIKVVGNGTPYRNYKLHGSDLLYAIQELSGDSQQSRSRIRFSYAQADNNLDYSLSTSDLAVTNIEQRTAETVSLDLTGNGKLDFMVYPKTKDKFYLFKDENFRRAYTVNSGKFLNIFPTTWLNHQDKILSGSGFTVVQNSSDNKVKFKVYSNGASINPVVVQYEKSWTAPTYTNMITCNFGSTTQRIPQEYLSGDFNGDGLTDIIAISRPYSHTICRQDSGNCDQIDPIFDANPNQDENYPKSNQLIPCCDCNSTSVNNSGVTLINLDRRITSGFSSFSGRLTRPLGTQDKLIPADFDGDGKTDFLHFTPGNVYIYTFDENGTLMLLKQVASSRIKLDLPILLGDYNGDGKTDFTTPEKDNSKNFYTFISTGTTFKIFKNELSFTYRESYWNAVEGKRYGYNLIPVDLNNDGKTDIVNYSTETQNNSSNGVQKVQVYRNVYGTREIEKLVFTNGAYVKKTGNLKHLPVPIFLSSETPNYGLSFATISDKWVHSFQARPTSKELLKVENNGVEYNIKYSNLSTDGSAGIEQIYASATDQVYPYVNIHIAPSIKIVERLERKVEGIPNTYQRFYYRNAISHLEGLGFRGFQYLARSNWHTGAADRVYVNTTQDIELRSIVLQEYQTPYTQRFGNIPSDYIYKTDYTYEHNLSGNKVFKASNTSSTTQNQLEGTSTTTNTVFDQYNNPTKITMNYSGHGSTVTEYTYSNSTGSNYYIGRPTKKKVSFSIGSQSFNTEERYAYTGALINRLQTKGNGTQFDTETYTHDTFGNITKITTTPYGESSRIVNFTFDSSGRFLTKSTDIEDLETSYSYDTSTGLLLSDTNPYNQTTSYEYDTWNRPIKVTDFLGNTVTTSYDESDFQLKVTGTSNDGSSSETAYDELKRIMYERSKSLDGNWSQISYQYDALDRVNGRSEPHFGNAPSQWNTIEYDFYGRVKRENLVTGKTISYTYNQLITSVNDGTKTVTTTRNALGNITKVDDPGGTIRYTYFGNGNMKSSSYEGATQTIEQDGWGRKTKLTDPSAGVYTYEYNGFSELIKQTSPKGTTTNTYSPTGRMISSRIKGDLTDMTTSYTYDAVTKMLTNISGNDAVNRKTYQYSYYYDQHLRPKSVTENTGTASFSINYDYDSFSRIKKETYYADFSRRSSSTSVTYNYNDNGALTGFDQWKIKQVNARGQINKIELGTGDEESYEYDAYGFITKNAVYNPKLNTTYYQQTYKFDPIRETLSQRSHKTVVGTYRSDYEENFKYDTQDRLISINQPHGSSFTYDHSGRITSDSKIGDIAYQGGSKRYQIKDVTLNFQGEQFFKNKETQQISYNAFKKPVEVYAEGRGRITFEYGPLGNRSRAWYGGLDKNKEDRKYHKQYASIIPAEIIHNKEDNSYKFIFFKGGNAYNAPLVTIEQMNDHGNEKSDYYLQRDHLGSIVNITKEVTSGNQTQGQFQEHRRFGAWGTIDKYHSIKGGSFDRTSLLDRGFTGHEHFVEVGLIHMNGRMYDPSMKRFLSPDNYIQNPYNTQNYNRYSYVLNNPLMYTDPSGQMYEDEGTGFEYGGSIIGGVVSTFATNWDNWGMKDFFNNDFTRPFREIGRWVRGWFEKADPSVILKMPEASASVDPLIAPNPAVNTNLVTTNFSNRSWAEQAFFSFKAGQINTFKGIVQGLKTIVTDPGSLFTAEAYWGSVYAGFESTSPTLRTFSTTFRLQSAASTGDLNQIFHTLGGEFAGLQLDVASALPGIGIGGKAASSVGKTRVFWVGGGTGGPAHKAAQSFARQNGMITLDMKWYGKLGDFIHPYLSKGLQNKMWDGLSYIYARNAKSTVYTFFGRDSMYAFDKSGKFIQRSVWYRIEYKNLFKRGIDYIVKKAF